MALSLAVDCSHDPTASGLAIVRDAVTLDRYVETRLIGGPDAFVERVEDYAGFAAAIRRRLLRELARHTVGPPGAQVWKRSST